MDGNLSEIKDLIDEQGRAWHAFREENDKGRKADGEKLDRLNKHLDEITDRCDRIEVAFKRAPRVGFDTSESASQERKDAAAFFTAATRERVSEERADVEAYGSYKLALDKFLRSGRDGLQPDETRALSIGNDTAGGFLAPTESEREIIKGVTEISPIRSIARVRQTTSTSLTVPKRTGQFAAVWVAEQGARAATDGLTYGQEEVPNSELYALVDLSMQLIEDAGTNMDSELNMEFTEQFALAEGTAFVNGNGVGRPEGFMTHSDVGETNSGTAATIADANGQANGIIDLYHALKSDYARNGTWVLNRTTLGAVRKLKDGQNQYIWMPGLADLRPNTILGASYLETQDMPDEGANAFPIAFGDFRRAYTIVDRIGMSILRDPYTQATSGNMRFIARRRVGGQVLLAEAIRKLKCSA